jgi:hypothetical protein
MSALAQMAGMAAVDLQFEPSLCRGEPALLKPAEKVMAAPSDAKFSTDCHSCGSPMHSALSHE